MACQKIKLALIGSGMIGGTLAHLASVKNFVREVVLFDLNADMAKGKALDISQSLAVEGQDVVVRGAEKASDLEGADVVIVTAGIPRKPGMSRSDLLATNAKVMKEVGEQLKQFAPNAFVICITNPLDVMVGALQEFSGLPKHKVVGMAGVLDTARFKTFLSEALKVSVQDIDSFVLGGHGDSMVPVLDYTTISGIPLKTFVEQGKLSQEELDSIVDRTRKGGAEIVGYLKTGSAFYAPAASALEMAASYVYDQKRILPCAVALKGEYGYSDLYVGVPCIIGAEGVEEILELPLSTEEKAALDISVQGVQTLVAELKAMDL